VGICVEGRGCFCVPQGSLYGHHVATLGDQTRGVEVPQDGIVDGYSMGFPEGTSLAAAQTAVLKTVPADTQTTSQRTASSSDGSRKCYLWNLQSATLAAPMGDAKIGDSTGGVGVVLTAIGPNGDSPYSASNINNADISAAPSSPTDTC
jgi:hypothetical protein